MMGEEKQAYSYPIDPDRELLLWEKWVRIREEETKFLANATNRPPADLVMNLLEKVREDKERKVALEHAVITKKPAVRGTLWEQPCRLKQKCYCEQVYEVQRTNVEMGRPAVIEHIGVPEYIQATEKGVTGDSKRKPCSLLDSDYISYRNKREEDLKEKIKKIDPFRPEIAKLVIKGSKPKTPPKKMPPLPLISVCSANEIPEDDLCTVYALKINDTVVFKDIPGQNLTHLRRMQKDSSCESCYTWTYYFNVPVKRIGRSKLYLENLGTVSLRYCWKKIKRPIPFIPEAVFEQVFFFNKNENVLYPGQKRNILFTFVSEKADIYSEFWELSFCNICFFNTLADKLVVNLYADSTENIEQTLRETEKIKEKINEKAIRNIAINLINDAIKASMITEPQIYPYEKLFLESEMFIMKNPVCFYHQTEVLKMNDMYTELAPGEIWDLSISSWRKKMMEKDYDERMKYYELLRKSHDELLKPWYEGESLLAQKYRAIKILLGQLADSFDEMQMRVFEMYGLVSRSHETIEMLPSLSNVDRSTSDHVRNVFYLLVYEQVATTMETCAGVLSSIELNRWIDFDFCRT